MSVRSTIRRDSSCDRSNSGRGRIIFLVPHIPLGNVGARVEIEFVVEGREWLWWL